MWEKKYFCKKILDYYIFRWVILCFQRPQHPQNHKDYFNESADSSDQVRLNLRWITEFFNNLF